VSVSVEGTRMRGVRTLATGIAIAAALWTLVSGHALAQDVDLELASPFISPEHFVLELRGGPYTPEMDGNAAFGTHFTGDSGLLFGVELDVIMYRLPNWLYLGAGGRIETAEYDGETLSDEAEKTSEETSLRLWGLDMLAVARIDALARKLSVPLIVTGKLGYGWMHWSTNTGGEDKHDGWSVGLAWGLQFAIDLDALDRAAARNLDEEWGINHAFLFFELSWFHPTDDSLPIGDNSWAAGLGFVF
jgi:hypothetical protein